MEINRCEVKVRTEPGYSICLSAAEAISIVQWLGECPGPRFGPRPGPFGCPKVMACPEVIDDIFHRLFKLLDSR